jgi:uncharacterized protein (TIGR03083 family)
MQLRPVYGERPLVAIDLPRTAPVHPVVAQRRRFQAALASLDDGQWGAPTRCDGWSVQDVVTHLITTNQFWLFSIQAGLSGEPTQFLATFDPVATPAQLVDDAGSPTPAETLGAFTDTNEALLAVVEGLDDEQLALRAESPPGHVAIQELLDHALWDSWVHERDVFLEVGAPPPEEPAEVRSCLRYAAALGPGFAVMYGSPVPAATAIEPTDLDERFVVTVVDDQVQLHEGPAPDGATVISGPAVELVEQLSFRATQAPPAAGVAELHAGLGQVFDQA